MGAVPGGGLLIELDVERYRAATARRAVVWRPDHPTLVLGSTQAAPPPGDVPAVRRRSGGGAVLVVPGETVWVDAWVPRHDPLWCDDVIGAATWVGEWWARGLSRLTGATLDVHRGGSLPRPWADRVCFAGVGPGEVLSGGRKVVGVAQWRSRQGALFQASCYRHWDPEALVGRLGIPEAVGDVRRAAAGLDELTGRDPPSLDAVIAALLDALPPGSAWEVTLPHE